MEINLICSLSPPQSKISSTQIIPITGNRYFGLMTAGNDVVCLTISSFHMMTSSNGNIFRVTCLLWGESTGDRWIPLTKASDAELWCFFMMCAWTNGWSNSRDADELRHHCAHCDVTVITIIYHDTYAFFRQASFSRSCKQNSGHQVSSTHTFPGILTKFDYQHDEKVDGYNIALFVFRRPKETMLSWLG